MKKLNECSCGCGSSGSCENHEGPRNYMFFENLKTLRSAIDALMQIDPNLIDSELEQGHDWAADHIASAKDDVEEVANFFINKSEPREPFRERPFVKTFESFIKYTK